MQAWPQHRKAATPIKTPVAAIAAASALTALVPVIGPVIGPVLAPAPALPQAQAQAQTLSVVQGASLLVAGNNGCTLGYNDLLRGVSYTAAHCGNPGDTVQVRTGAGYSEVVGRLERSTAYGRSDTGNDWAVIVWNDNVALAGNGLSGSTRSSISELAPGDRICSYGAATRRQQCGEFIGTIGNNLYWEGPSGDYGDSGGPVWAEGKGFVGVYGGMSTVVSPAGEFPAMRASAPANGPAVSTAQEMQLLASYFDISRPRDVRVESPVEVEPVVPPAPAPALSSDPAALTALVAVIAGVLIAVGPAIGEMIRISQGWL